MGPVLIKGKKTGGGHTECFSDSATNHNFQNLSVVTNITAAKHEKLWRGTLGVQVLQI